MFNTSDLYDIPWSCLDVCLEYDSFQCSKAYSIAILGAIVLISLTDDKTENHYVTNTWTVFWM